MTNPPRCSSLNENYDDSEKLELFYSETVFELNHPGASRT
jgi:hypothetical protein